MVEPTPGKVQVGRQRVIVSVSEVILSEEVGMRKQNRTHVIDKRDSPITCH
jgi:hypothetical protein